MICDLTLEDANVLAFFMREIDAKEIMATNKSEYRHEFAQICFSYGGGWCCKDSKGMPYAMGGIVEHWPGVGTAWMVAMPDIEKHGIEVTKAAKAMLVTHKKLHRIQAYSAAFHTISHEWLKRLGFAQAHTLRKYGKNGEDFYLFEIVR